MSIAFDCAQCGKHYEVNEELAARRARCSACQTVFRVPEPTAILATSSDDEYRLAVLFNEEFGPAIDSELEETKPCPSCAAPLLSEAVLCIQCGYHSKKGRKIALDQEDGTSQDATSLENSVRRPSASQTLSRQRKRQSGFTPASYIRGTLISLVFALIGGGLWAFASLATDYSLGFLAWAVGGLAGLGMALVHQDEDGTLAGITSAFMALVGCVFSKVLYFALFLSAFTGTLNENSKEYVAEIVAEDEMRISGKDPEEVDEVYYDQQVALAMQEVDRWDSTQLGERIALNDKADRSEAYVRLMAQKQEMQNDGKPLRADQYTAVIRQIDRMSDAEVVAFLEETPAITYHAADAPILESETPAPAAPPATSLFAMFLLALLAFGIFGGVFLVLGMVSAYRLGSGNLVA
jgi:hypothetical protein